MFITSEEFSGTETEDAKEIRVERRADLVSVKLEKQITQLFFSNSWQLEHSTFCDNNCVWCLMH